MSDEFAGALCTGLACFAPSLALAAWALRVAMRSETTQGRLLTEVEELRREVATLRGGLPSGTSARAGATQAPSAARVTAEARSTGAGGTAEPGAASAATPTVEAEEGPTDEGVKAEPGAASAASPTDAGKTAEPGAAAAGSTGTSSSAEPGAGSAEPGAGSAEPGVGSAEPGAAAAGSTGTGAKPGAAPPSARPPPRAGPPPVVTSIDTARLIERGAVWFFAAVGGLLAVVAVLFGLREVVAAGWLGPPLRFALGVLVGISAFTFGELLRSRRYTVPAEALFAVGAGASYASVYAGHARYGLYGGGATFALLVAVAGAVLFVAARRGSRFGLYLAAIGAWMVPILLSTGENRPVAFFAYVALVDLAVLYVARRRDWMEAVVISGVVTATFYLGWTFQWRAPDQVLVGLGAATLLGLLHALVPGRTGALGLAGALTGAGLWGLGVIAFGTPTDPMASDPRSGMALPMPQGDAVWLAAATLLGGLAAFGAWVRGRMVETGIVLLAAALGVMATTLGWSVVEAPPTWPLVVITLGAPVVTLLATGSAFSAALIPFAGLVYVVAALVAPPPAPVMIVAAVGLALLAGWVGWVREERWMLLAGVFAPVFLVYAGLPARLIAGETSWVLATSALLYAMLACPPFLRPRPKDLFGALSAVTTNLLLFWPFYQTWVEVLGDDHVGILAVLFAASLLLGAAVLVRVTRAREDDRELAIVVGVVLLFLSVAVPLELRNAWLTVGWAIEVVLLGAVSRRLSHPGLRAFGVLLAAAVTVRLLLNPAALYYGDGSGLMFLNWTLYTWGVPLVCFLVAARLYASPAWFPGALVAAAVLFGFALLNLEIAHAFARDRVMSFSSEALGEQMTRSISWAMYGLLLIVFGVLRDKRALRFMGLLFAVLGAGKVFLVDLWSLSGFARVGALAGVAVTLLLAAVAFQRLVLRERTK